MRKDLDRGSKSSLDAKFDAQRIAFGPLMFQAARLLRDTGILRFVEEASPRGATPSAVAEAVGMSEYGAKALLEAGLSMELVHLHEGRYALARTGWFMLHDELTRVNMDFVQDVCYLGMHHLGEAIAEGRPAGLDVFGDWPTIYEGLSQLPPGVQKSWFAFDHFYSDGAFPKVLPLLFGAAPRPRRLLDVGGNTGKFALACTRHDPDVHVTILDHPGQLAMAMESAREAGVGDRVSGHPIDLLDHTKPYPTGHDVIWMSQFLVCFPEEDIVQLVRRARDAMGPDSELCILDTYWDRQRYDISTYCLHASSLYFTCMANGTSKMLHSDEMLRCVQEAGLVVAEQVDHIDISHTLMRCRLP